MRQNGALIAQIERGRFALARLAADHQCGRAGAHGHIRALDVGSGSCSAAAAGSRAAGRDFHGWARQIEGVFRTLVAVPAEVNFALDPNFAILYPYRNPARPGDRLPIELRVTNHGTADAMARASLTPPGWSVSPGEATTTIAAGESGALRFVVEVPAGSMGRHVLCAELALGERRFGQIAEGLVDVT